MKIRQKHTAYYAAQSRCYVTVDRTNLNFIRIIRKLTCHYRKFSFLSFAHILYQDSQCFLQTARHIRRLLSCNHLLDKIFSAIATECVVHVIRESTNSISASPYRLTMFLFLQLGSRACKLLPTSSTNQSIVHQCLNMATIVLIHKNGKPHCLETSYTDPSLSSSLLSRS